jgi:hypothetical protein
MEINKMAKWQFILEFGDFYHLYDIDGDLENRISLQKLAKRVAERIAELVPKVRNGVKFLDEFGFAEMGDVLEYDILPMFQEISENEHSSVEDFDDALCELYDWADTPLDEDFSGKKMCWVNTFR